MEATKTKPVGNPALRKPSLEKDARFKLINNYDYLKPVDGNTNQPLDNPYPPTYIAVNAGVAWDEKKGEFRQWRYIFGYSSIWVDEQTKPAPTQNQLFSEKNDIIFKGGFIRIDKKDIAKYHALTVNDGFLGNENPVNEVPKVFEIIDEQAESKKLRNQADIAFEAESEARNCSDEEMMPIAQLYGIDTSVDADLVRTQFIFQAKASPAKFLENFANPKYKTMYIVTEALKSGKIEVKEGKVIFALTGKAAFSINENADVAEQIAVMVMKGDEVASKLIDNLQNSQ